MLSALVDLAIVITLAEIFLLMFVVKHPLPKVPLLAGLVAGFCLLAALRLSVGEAGLAWIGMALAGSAVAHLIDLKARWQAKAGDVFHG